MKMAKSNTISFTVPDDLKLKLDVISKIGLYDSLSEFLRDAIRQLFAQHKELRISVAYTLFHQKKIGMGKAAEFIGDSIEETTKMFKQREFK